MKISPFGKMVLALVAVAILIVLNFYLTDRFFQQVIVSPFRQSLAVLYTRLGQWRMLIFSSFRTGRIVEENIYLAEENRRLRAENLKIADLIQENDFLRTELGVAKQMGYQLEMARIFQFNTAGQFRTALIDKGSDDGLAVGEAVIFKGNVISGVVGEVYPAYSLVFLINDPRVSLNVKLADNSVFGRTKGALEKGLFLELVTNQEEVREGQMVVTSGLDGLPDLLMVGQVVNVQLKSGELFKTVRIEPFGGDPLLEDVFILKGKKAAM